VVNVVCWSVVKLGRRVTELANEVGIA